MKHKTGIILAVLLLILVSGCSTTSRKSNTQLSQEYLSKAQENEKQGRLVEALEQYKLAIAVDPKNQLAQEKSTSIERELNKIAEEHYKTGLRFHSRGRYNEARKEFLTALRYNPEHAGAKDKLTTTRKEIEQVKRYIVHTIQPDESISTLAQKYYGDYRKFHLIAEYNELEDATKVSVGQEIKIPVVEGIPIIADRATIQTETGESPESMPGEIITVKRSVTHIVQPGESLSKLAAMYYGDYTKYDIIAEFNGLTQGTSVRVGQELKIPEVEGVPFLAKATVEEEKQVPMIQEPPATEKVIEKPKEEETPTFEDQTANYRELGIELYKNKEYADAITELNKVLNVNPSDSSAREYIAKSHFQQGLTLFRKEQYLKARDEFKASLENDQDCKKCNENIRKCEDTYKEIHYNKGLEYFGDQKLADAIGEWESVYALDPNYKDVSNNLTKARTLLERLESIKRSKTKE